MLQPLWQLVLFTFVFRIVMRIPLEGTRTQSFALFLFAAFIPWIAVSEGLTRATTALTDSAELIKKMSFPPHLLVVTAVLGGLIQSGLAAVVFLVGLGVAGEARLGMLWLMVPAVALQLALTLGLGLLLAALHVYVRDTIQVVGFLLMTWFYLTPVVYPLGIIPDGLPQVAAAIRSNPLTGLVGLYRSAFLGEALEPLTIVPLALAAAVALTVGAATFRSLRGGFADEL